LGRFEPSDAPDFSQSSHARRRRLLHQFDIDRDLHVVSDENATCLERLVVGQAEVASLDPRGRAEAGPFVTPGIHAASLGNDLQHHFAGDATDGELAGQIEWCINRTAHAVAEEPDVGIPFDVEEIRGSEVAVALSLGCRCSLD